MTRNLTVFLLLLCASVSACGYQEQGSSRGQDTFVKFTSHLGTSFVAPSKWTTTDQGDTFTLKSQDGLAAITAIAYTKEGSGSLNEFRESMATGLLPKEASQWKDSK